MNRPNVTTAIISDDPQAHEDVHVHDVYDHIASHFSMTRYKVRTTILGSIQQLINLQPWPIVAQFLSSLPAGSIGLDSGTGNGKYLPLRSGCIWTIGLDRSRNLLNIARTAGDSGTFREVVLGDVLGHGWRRGAYV
jgi:tRNA (uracil-5-)-methyltransferase TRM9